MILDAHGWPQWDVWILPFIVAAFTALKIDGSGGCLLAVGAMLKGPLLFVAPFLFSGHCGKEMASHAACARRFCGDDSADSFAVAFAHPGGMDRRGYCRWY
jgi:hypothetical protein